MTPTHHRHSVVWLDHYQALVMHVHPDGAESVRISSDRAPEERQLHRRSGQAGDGRLPNDRAFFAKVAEALAESEVVLVCGPGVAKTSFMDSLQRRCPDIATRVRAVETMDHPTEGQLGHYGQTYFKRLQTLGML